MLPDRVASGANLPTYPRRTEGKTFALLDVRLGCSFVSGGLCSEPGERELNWIAFCHFVQVLPLFCVALFIPVLGSISAVFGDTRTLMTTSTILLGSFFNQTSFLVLGSLAINAIFSKCGILDLLMSILLRRWKLESKSFLLVIMLCTMTACSVLCSGLIVVLAALKPLMRQGLEETAIKRLLLGVAFSANAGSILLPISSTTTLITLSLLRDFDHKLSLVSWIFVSGPVALFGTVLCWWILVKLFPAEGDANEEVYRTVEEGLEEADRPQLMRQWSLSNAPKLVMTDGHWFMLMVTCVAVLGMTVFAEALEPVVGHPAILALAVVVVAFGSGFMSRDEYLTLEWDLLAIVGGTNVMAVMIRETALAANASVLLTQGIFDFLAFWPFLILVVCLLLIFGTFCGHSLTAVLVLPLLVPLGVKLEEAESFALLCCIAIPFGMGMPSASFDNMAAQMFSQNLKRKRCELSVRDFFHSGGLMALTGGFLTVTLGFGVSSLQHGLPKVPTDVLQRRTPAELEPKVVKENRVLDGKQKRPFLKMLGQLHAFGTNRTRPRKS
ncbi:unnamed protein product [Durusdinium trenchii]|uniref:Citrate transporter-like domain-containing protein n=3 Tax=Durusdinium trenchii TaxID=1381693 RepID=A0ABP0IQP3_9DINO